jgi:hypothetical protein
MGHTPYTKKSNRSKLACEQFCGGLKDRHEYLATKTLLEVFPVRMVVGGVESSPTHR